MALPKIDRFNFNVIPPTVTSNYIAQYSVVPPPMKKSETYPKSSNIPNVDFNLPKVSSPSFRELSLYEKPTRIFRVKNPTKRDIYYSICLLSGLNIDDFKEITPEWALLKAKNLLNKEIIGFEEFCWFSDKLEPAIRSGLKRYHSIG